MKVSDVLLLLIKGILFLLISVLITNFNWIIQFILIGFLFFLGGLWIVKKNTTFNGFISVLLIYTPFFLVYGIPSIKGGSYQTFPIWGVALFSSLIAIWVKLRANTKFYLWIYPVLVVAIGLLGMPNYLNFILQPSSFSKESLPAVSFLSESDKKVNLQDMGGEDHCSRLLGV